MGRVKFLGFKNVLALLMVTGTHCMAGELGLQHEVSKFATSDLYSRPKCISKCTVYELVTLDRVDGQTDTYVEAHNKEGQLRRLTVEVYTGMSNQHVADVELVDNQWRRCKPGRWHNAAPLYRIIQGLTQDLALSRPACQNTHDRH